ncbi:MAG: hypothetical protein ABR613_06220 [Actinomycetota bacterium]
MRKRNIAAVSAIVALMGVALPASPANAVASAGFGTTCDETMTHCVTTEVAGVGAGTTVTQGYFTAVCKAQTTGALATSVTCSSEGASRTVSLPGPVGASAVVARTSKLTGHQVCWSSTGFFINPLGGVITVTDADCAIVTA